MYSSVNWTTIVRISNMCKPQPPLSCKSQSSAKKELPLGPSISKNQKKDRIKRFAKSQKPNMANLNSSALDSPDKRQINNLWPDCLSPVKILGIRRKVISEPKHTLEALKVALGKVYTCRRNYHVANFSPTSLQRLNYRHCLCSCAELKGI